MPSCSFFWRVTNPTSNRKFPWYSWTAMRGFLTQSSVTSARVCLFKTQAKWVCLFGLPVNFFLNVVYKLGYENFNTCWRILIWLILVVSGMIYKWLRKGQHSFTCLTCQALKLCSVFFILLTILHCSESSNMYGF